MPDTIKCAHCGAELPDRQAAYERNGKFYCSQACADAADRQ